MKTLLPGRLSFALLRVILAVPAMAASRGQSVMDSVPLTFEPNAEAESRTVPFVARGQGFQLRFERSKVSIRLASGSIGMRFVRGASSPVLQAEDRLPHKANFLHGSSAASWRTNVEQYAQLRYRDLYSGIDLVFHGNQRRFEYDFVVRPGADLEHIEMAFDGARASIGESGDLFLDSADGRLVHHAPVLYQERPDGSRSLVQGRYRSLGGNRIGFTAGRFDQTLPLVIDPVMQFSGYLGGKAPNGADDVAYATAVDSEGNIYVTGRTVSSDFPLQGSMQGQNKGSGDAFVTKLDPTGQKVLYSTYIGGRALEYSYAIAVDSFGQVHITGQTGSDDFPVKNAFQSKKTGLNNLFVTKLNASGDGIIFSTLMGGDRNDAGRGIAVDPFGNVLVGGFTNSTTFPALNAMQPKQGGSSDGVIAKFTPDGKLLFSTFLGGPSGDEIYALAVDQAGNAYVTGTTASQNLATANAAQFKLFPRDAFAAKVMANGSALAYFTYIGGNGTDEGHAIAVDASGNAYVGGFTGSRDFPVTKGVIQESIAGNSDGFITKVNENGTAFVWSTRIGGSGVTPALDDEMVKAIALDPDGCVYAAGSTVSKDFPSNRATQANQGGKRDVFLTKLTAQADQVIFSTFVGGAEHDEAYGLAISPLRAMFVAGQTFSRDFPVEKGVSESRGGNSDGFITRICDPVMFLSAGSFDFTWVQGTEIPAKQTLTVAACRDLALSTAIDGETSWLSAEPQQPAAGVTGVVLAVAPGTLDPGDYQTTVTVVNPDVFFGPKTVTVTLRVLPPPPPPM